MQPLRTTGHDVTEPGAGGGLNGAAARPRVCFIATGLARGGAEVQLFRAASGLRARGFDVQTICMLSADYFGARLEEAGISVTYLHASRTTNPLSILMRFLRCIRKERPTVLAGFDYPGSMLARVGGAIARIPVVICSIRSENIGGTLRRLALTLTDPLAMTTTNSHAVAEKLVNARAASRRRMRVIPNGIDFKIVGPHLRQGRSALRRALHVQDDEFLWVAVGNLEAPKDYPNLLHAVAALGTAGRRFKVLIAGKGPLRHALEQQMVSLGLEGTVRFLGFRGDGPACMAAADATVLASAWEGLPNVMIESLAVGTPVVCTDVGGVREIVKHGESGFVVPPRDPHALAGGMWSLMARSAKRRHAMGLTGRHHVERHFALDRVVDQWSGLVYELVGAS